MTLSTGWWPSGHRHTNTHFLTSLLSAVFVSVLEAGELKPSAGSGFLPLSLKADNRDPASTGPLTGGFPLDLCNRTSKRM